MNKLKPLFLIFILLLFSLSSFAHHGPGHEKECPVHQHYSLITYQCEDRCPEFMYWNDTECAERCPVDSHMVWNQTVKRCVPLFDADPIIEKEVKEMWNPVKIVADKFFNWWGRTMKGILF